MKGVVLGIPEGLNDPLDLAEDVRNGNLYVVELMQMGRRGQTQDGRISLLRPA